jgi:hypothetical protein
VPALLLPAFVPAPELELPDVPAAELPDMPPSPVLLPAWL